MKQIKLAMTGLLLTAQLGLAIQREFELDDISGLDKQKLLQTLYERASIGQSMLHSSNYNSSLTDRDAQQVIKWKPKVEILNGRALFIDFSNEKINTSRYNDFHGTCAAEMVIAKLRMVEQEKDKGIVDISDLDKKKLVQALYMNAKPSGINVASPDSLHDAELEALVKTPIIYGVQGKFLGIKFSENTLHTLSYNFMNGENAAEKVVTHLKTQWLQQEKANSIDLYKWALDGRATVEVFIKDKTINLFFETV